MCTVVLTVAIAMPAMAILHFEHAAGQRVDMDAFIVFPMYWSMTNYSNDQKDAGSENDRDLVFTTWGDSRFTTTLTSGPLSGTFQVGIPNDFEGVKVRLLSGTWTINDAMSLTIGKFFAPYYFWGNSRLGGDLGEGGYGSNWDDFDPGVSFNVKGFYIYLKEPVGPDKGHANSPANDYFGGAAADDVDYTLPRAYIGYNSPKIADRVNLYAALGYNTFKLRKESISFNKSVNAWIGNLYADVNLTDMLLIRGGGTYGSNQEEMGICFIDGAGAYTSAIAGAIVTPDGDVENTTTYSAFVELHAKLGKITAMTGYGYGSSKNKAWEDINADWTKKDAHQTYFVRAEIPLYEHETGANITINPEVNVFDELKGRDGKKEEKQINVGVIAQVHF